jgi:HlyD family secretion protein
VTRGSVVETVDATGTVEAVTTVLVGTQVSGTIQSLKADFNSRVRKGQVIAELDPSLFRTQVDQAQATVARLEADVERAVVAETDTQQKLRRARDLFARQLIPSSELDTAETNALQASAALKSAQAQVTQARASLNQAQVNLGHTVITAPIDGIVISRNVDVGQTVAASMQAPTLFTIARDLTRMQVRASVGEADIGRVEVGQPARFRVDAYPDALFSGIVSQIRLQPVVEQNVVSYTTVIDVPNVEMRLKPGMTATVTVEIARRDDVLRVPNAALRFQPSADLFLALGQTPVEPHDADGRPASSEGADRTRREVETGSQRGSMPPGREAPPAAGARRGRVWVFLEDHGRRSDCGAGRRALGGRAGGDRGDDRADRGANDDGVAAPSVWRPASGGRGSATRGRSRGGAVSESPVPVVRVCDLTKTYTLGEVDVHALRGVTIDVMPGEFVMLTGPSGSGKSTFMHLIGCLDRPTSGRYWLNGRDVSSMPARTLARVRNSDIGFVFQGFNLLPRTSALENVELPLLYGAPVSTRERRARARAALEAVGLGDRLGHYANQLSGGQQQRVAIARSLVNNPTLLLADEPTGNLDTRTSIEMMGLFQQLNQTRGLTILLVTHERDIAEYGERIVTFRDGRVEHDRRVADRRHAVSELDRFDRDAAARQSA